MAITLMRFTNTLGLVVFILFIGCDKSEDLIIPEITNNAIISIDGFETTFINEDHYGNTNCDFINIGVTNYFEEKNGYGLSFRISKNGDLRNVELKERLPEGTSGYIPLFLTPYYNPASSISISNFQYDPVKNDVYFEFIGSIFREDDNSIVRNIQGFVDSKNLDRVNCGATIFSINYNSPSISFHSMNWVRSSYSTGEQIHSFLSNNGYKIEFNLDQNIGDMPLGNYPITETSPNIFLDFSEYVGPINAVQVPVEDPNNWALYKTRGSFTITDKVIENVDTKVIGVFNLEILNDNQVFYTIDNMKFTLYGNSI